MRAYSDKIIHETQLSWHIHTELSSRFTYDGMGASDAAARSGEESKSGGLIHVVSRDRKNGELSICCARYSNRESVSIGAKGTNVAGGRTTPAEVPEPC